MSTFTYVGKELDLFARATNWKIYISSLISEFIKGDVLEVGAGIGSNTEVLLNSQYCKWLCLEPDTSLFQSLQLKLNSHRFINHYAKNDTINAFTETLLFDAILYLDVLEHIQMDGQELLRASQLLRKNGNLVILSPSHECLFSCFDSSVGHYRRYNKKMFQDILPEGIEVVKCIYLDCCGLLANLINKLILKQSMPSLKQIEFWDKFVIPVSKNIDPKLNYGLGKSILLIARKVF